MLTAEYSAAAVKPKVVNLSLLTQHLLLLPSVPSIAYICTLYTSLKTCAHACVNNKDVQSCTHEPMYAYTVSRIYIHVHLH